ncbi:hypothetical protein IWQ60_000373 [Tieghemiomyces parasiticus]|uniref:ELMO domain-containing protein n=1 Tax=Tieghemiomyces parasiticus TaxID=78921 RepID=A0A9W8AIM4_9FUNG|nr:hypothetical protein IWQ60_000373 [Tieghemiomyces parasiticus]
MPKIGGLLRPSQTLTNLTPTGLIRLRRAIYYSRYLGPVRARLELARDLNYTQLARRTERLKGLNLSGDHPTLLDVFSPWVPLYTLRLTNGLAAIHRANRARAVLNQRKCMSAPPPLAASDCLTLSDAVPDDPVERTLLRLWDNLRPALPRASPTPVWPDAGFQGADPRTDFRGMGLLALDAMDYYATRYTESAQLVLKTSREHTQAWYTFGIVGINLTALAWRLYNSPELEAYVLQAGVVNRAQEAFFDLFSYLVHVFNDFWFAPAASFLWPATELDGLARRLATGTATDEPTVRVASLSRLPLSLRYRYYRSAGLIAGIGDVDINDAQLWPTTLPFTIMDFESVVPRFEAQVRRLIQSGEPELTLDTHPFLCWPVGAKADGNVDPPPPYSEAKKGQ